MNVDFVEVDGVKIAFRSEKHASVVYIHGSGCDGSLWDLQLKEIGGYAIDLPGHGESEDADIDSVHDYAFYVANAVKKNLEKAVLVGHSLGGAIAQSIYLSFREVVSGLVLVGTGARLRVLPEILKGLEEKSEKTVDFLVELSFASKLKVAEKIKKQFMERIEVLLRDLKACDKFDLLERYKKGEIKVDVPTLIVVGEQDRLTPVKYAQFFKSVIPHADLVIIENAGHMVMLEKAKEFNKAIIDFLKCNF